MFSEEETHGSQKVTMRPKGARSGWCGCKPRNARHHQNLEVGMNCSRKDSWWHFTSGSMNCGRMNFGCFMPPRKPTLTARWPWHYHWLQSLFVPCRQSWLPPLWCPLAPYTASVPAWPSGLEMSLILSLECLKDRHHPGHLDVCSAQPRTGIDTHLIMMEGGSMFPGPHWHSVSV